MIRLNFIIIVISSVISTRGNAWTLSGPTSVYLNEEDEYSISGASSGIFWNEPSRGTIVWWSNSDHSRATSIRVHWNSTGGTSVQVEVNFSPKSKTVTVNGAKPPNPNITTFSASTNLCGDKTVSYTQNPPTGVTWYWQSTFSGTSTANPTKSTTASVEGPYPYYVRARHTNISNCSGAGCWSTASSSITVTVNKIPANPPSATVSTNTCGPKTISYATPSDGSTIYWQGTNWDTGTAFAFGTPPASVSVSGNYYMRAYKNGCWSPGLTLVQATVKPIPVDPTPMSISSGCGDRTITYNYSGDGSIPYWQDENPNGTTLPPISNPTTVYDLPEAFTKTYYVRNYKDGCWSNNSAGTTVTVKPIPSPPYNAEISTNTCGDKIVTYHPLYPDGTDYWQGQNSDGFDTPGPGMNPPPITQTGGYFAKTLRDGCWSSSKFYSITVNPNPVAPDTPTATTNTCDAKILTRGTPPSSVGWYWQGINQPNGQEYTAPESTSTTYEAAVSGDYYIRGRSDVGCWGPSTKLHVDIDPEYITLDEYDPTNPVVEATVGIILGPGFVVPEGSPFTAKVGISEVCEERINWTEQVLYGPGQTIVGLSKSYFDGFGHVLQSQSKSMQENKFFAAQPLYGRTGRAEANTLPAPTIWDDFRYQKDFVRNETGGKYTDLDFDRENTSGPGAITNPKPVGDEKAYTLGWYYSANNTVEPLTPVTDFPYSRSYVPEGPDPTLTKSAGPGDANRMGSGHEVITQRSKINTGELDHYFSLRGYFTSHDPGLNTNLGYKYVTTDPNGKTSTSYTDADGRDVASFADNKWSYTYYNDAGQVVASVAPNGVNTASSAMPNFVTTYTYDNMGRMIETTSPDEGTSRFVYSTDGKIRFSENQEQRNASPKRFSYTNYDKLGRLIESGEYTVNGTNPYVFEPHTTSAPATYSVLNIVDNIGFTGVTGDAGDTRCKDVNYIAYDMAVAGYPTEGLHPSQENLIGQVARTKNDNSTTWYSYDEFGRLAWMKQSVPDFATKTIDYTYDYFGNVTQVAYQKGQADDFYHHYEYDQDQRLTAVYTSLDGTNQTLKARYEYYLTGQLKRIELGGDKQGIDYVYNIDGSLKLINHPDPALDPGLDGISGENAAIRPDIFGLALDYHANDYTGAGYEDGSLTTSGFPDQYGGALKAVRWHSAVDGHTPRGYGFTYDNLYQMNNATWGDMTGTAGSYGFTPSGVQAYQENIGGYDKNGNISSLVRKDKLGTNIANFNYNYQSNTNKLTSVDDNSSPLLSYQYNAIGQMIQQTEGTKTMKVSYTPYGLVKEIRDATDQLMVAFAYDDRGNRLKKTTYEAGAAVANTRYINDVAGNLMAVYEQDLTISGPNLQIEVPIYGSGRVAVYKPQVTTTFYEVADHLGNIRGVIGAPETLFYTATMEDNGQAVYTNPRVQELAYFKNLSATEATTNFMNHTAPSTYVPAPEYSAYLRWVDGTAGIEPEEKSVGPAIGLKVEPGDKLNLEAYVKYEKQTGPYNRTAITGAMASILGNGFVGSAAGLDVLANTTQIFQNGLNTVVGAALGNGNDDDLLPHAYLYYLLYDKNFSLITVGWSGVPTDGSGGFNPGAESLTPHALMSIADITIEQPGYIYVFVANESEDTKVWFDDMKVTHERNDIVAGADFYPFGMPMDTRQITREDYRWDYQGQFSEKDEETGWNAFDLRMYDARIGRWISPDPYGQFASPYLGMGNNPIINSDPDGGLTGPGPGFVAGEWNSTILLAEAIVVTPGGSFVRSAASSVAKAVASNLDVFYNEKTPSMSFPEYQIKYPEFLGMSQEEANSYWEEKYSQKFDEEWNEAIRIEKIQYAQEKLDNMATYFNGSLAVKNVGVSNIPKLSPKSLSIKVPVASTVTKVSPYELTLSHGLRLSQKNYAILKASIKNNGIKESIKFVKYQGKKYVVDGHHRLRAAKELGLKNVPAQEVTLPFKGYKTVNDLFYSNY